MLLLDFHQCCCNVVAATVSVAPVVMHAVTFCLALSHVLHSLYKRGEHVVDTRTKMISLKLNLTEVADRCRNDHYDAAPSL